MGVPPRESPASPPIATDTVRIYPAVWVAARAQRLAGEIETWTMLRGLDRRGVGWIASADAVRGLRERYGLSRSRAYARLRPTAPARFWTRVEAAGGDRLYLCGVVRVARALGLEALGSPADVPLAAYRGVAGRRSWVLAAWLAVRSRDGRTDPISQGRISAHLGVAASTQRRYRAQGAIAEIRNVASATYDLHPDQPGRSVYDPRTRRWYTRLPLAYRVADAERGGRWADRALRRHMLPHRGGHRGAATRIDRRPLGRRVRLGDRDHYILRRVRHQGRLQIWEHRAGGAEDRW